MLIFAASTGARAGEQWATRWQDVDFDRGELDISRRVDALWRRRGTQKYGRSANGAIVGNRFTLKAWKVKSKFSKADDLIFPKPARPTIGQGNLIKCQFLPLFDGLGAVSVSIGMDSYISLCPLGSKPGWRPRRCRPSPATRRYRSQWTDMAIYSRATITGKQWTRLPVGYSEYLRCDTNRGGLGRELTRTYFTTKSSTVPTRSWGQVTERPKRLANKRSCHVPTV